MKSKIKKTIVDFSRTAIGMMPIIKHCNCAEEVKRESVQNQLPLLRGTSVASPGEYCLRICYQAKGQLFIFVCKLASNMLTVRTSEHGGRLRKYYHITDTGIERIEDFKNEWREVMSIYQFVMKEDEANE